MEKNKILVIDDEPQIVRALELLMQREGFEVRSAHDGVEALQAIAESPPDLILLDLMMPRMDGFELCQRIRATAEWKSMIIIILTAKGSEIEREKGIALGADHYVTKPFSTREIVQLIKVLQVSSTLLEQASAACQLRFHKIFLRRLILRLQGAEVPADEPSLPPPDASGEAAGGSGAFCTATEAEVGSNTGSGTIEIVESRMNIGGA